MARGMTVLTPLHSRGNPFPVWAPMGGGAGQFVLPRAHTLRQILPPLPETAPGVQRCAKS